MLHREITSSLPTSVPRRTITVPIPIKNTSLIFQKKSNRETHSECGEMPFSPSSSPPDSDFLKRLEQRNMCYNR
jgi:hypothetical protein